MLIDLQCLSKCQLRVEGKCEDCMAHVLASQTNTGWSQQIIRPGTC